MAAKKKKKEEPIEEPGPEPLTATDLSAIYDSLDDEAKLRITEVATRVKKRFDGRAAASDG